MIDAASPKTVRQLLGKYALSPLKRLGQNFLVDANALNRIAGALEPSCGYVAEVGAGLGALTVRLAAKAKKVLAYEIDAGLYRALSETLDGLANVTAVHADILKADLKKDAEEVFGGRPFAIAANLPYCITSPCILFFLESGLPWESMVLMMQKEVAQRLNAPPGDPAYGALTAAVAFFAQTRPLFNVSRRCFFPQPDVDSTVVRMTPLAYDPRVKDAYSGLVRGLFAKRRKTVANNLIQSLGLDKDAAHRLLLAADTDGSRRAETLGREDFLRLAQAWTDTHTHQ